MVNGVSLCWPKPPDCTETPGKFVKRAGVLAETMLTNVSVPDRLSESTIQVGGLGRALPPPG